MANSEPEPVSESRAVPAPPASLSRNIEVLDFPRLRWGTPQEVDASLRALHDHAERSATQAIGWYLREKTTKGRWSRRLRVGAILLTTLGGLAPMIASVGWPGGASGLQLGHLGYVFLGLAAAAVALDRFFGFSTAWMRYVATAQGLQRLLSEFRFDWAMLGMRLADRAPDADQVLAMMQRLKDFVAAVDREVAQETQVWIAEFQSSLAEIERNARTQMETQRPGAIEVSFPGGAELPNGWEISVGGATLGTVRGDRHSIAFVPPGLHRVAARWAVDGRTAEAARTVQVEPGAVARITLSAVAE
jgi:hypothetical protein